MKSIQKYIVTGLLVCCHIVVHSQVSPTTATTAAPTAIVATTPTAYSSSIKINYVRTWEATAPYTNEADIIANSRTAYQIKQATAYFDGLGRPLQTVAKQASPAQTDLISPIIYDELGRETYKYLPYTATTNNGKFHLNPFAEQNSFMQGLYNPNNTTNGEQFFYSKTIFEPSPLNRPTKTFAPGNSWVGSEGGTAEHAITLSYEINVANEVRIWQIGQTYANLPNSPDYYNAGELYKTVTTDEHGKKVIEYKDKEDKVVLKKVQISNTPSVGGNPHTGWLCTYYVYDDFGLLRFVIPPKATKLLANNSWSFTSTTMQNAANELCFKYEYDARNRMIAKKVPGAAWVYMVYDKRDRLVFTQDGNLRIPNYGSQQMARWMYTLYDALNRPVQTGMMLSNSSRTDLQTYVDNNTGLGIESDITQTANFVSNPPVDIWYNQRNTQINQYNATNSITFNAGFESQAGDDFVAEIVTGTTNSSSTTITILDNPIPPDFNTIPLTYSFYDNYTQTNKTYNTTNNSKLIAIGTDTYPENLPTTASALTKGMPTVSRVRIIENPNDLTLGKWLETATFYDEKSRPIQIIADNYKGGKDVITSLYDFSGKVLCTYSVHNNSSAGISNLRTLTQILYDHAGRVLEIRKQINDDANSNRTIARNTYNELGQLLTKDIGQKRDIAGNLTTNPLETDTYTYNIRGWLKGVNWNYGTSSTNPLTNYANDKWFGYDLSYDWGFSQNQYNGNIAGQRWMSAGDQTERAFGYAYDNANRLLLGDFNQNNGTASSPLWNKNLTSNGTGTIDFSITMGNGTDHATAYDDNGNILQMKQMGMTSFNTSATIDNLKYAYYSNSNKLQNVVDLMNAPSVGGVRGGLGDFRTATTHPQFTTKNAITTEASYSSANITAIADYGYDVNGNMISDQNKNLQGATGIDQTTGGAIVYNHLNLPYKITLPPPVGGVGGGGIITYIYDAAGNKLEKRVEDNTTAQPKQTQTTYLGSYIYENNTLQFFGQEEGRVRLTYNSSLNTYNYYYDYLLKDHLGNVRAMLTDEYKQDIYPAATIEDGATATEQLYYDIKPGNIVANPVYLNTSYQNNNGNPPVNNNPNSNTTANSQKMYRLNAATADKIGMGITLKVMAGDAVNILGKSFWHNNGTTPNNGYSLSNSLVDILTSLAGSNAVSNAVHGAGQITGSVLNSSTTTTTPLTTILNNSPTPTGNTPKAYINWILFDEHFVPVSANFNMVGVADAIKNHTLTANIIKNGYLYVYCSNESNKDVLFDNLQVVHTRSPILEETHYYPFGLTMAGISSRAANSLENRRKFNDGTELNIDLDLSWYETDFRSYDPQIGRFHQIDELTEFDFNWSPYVYAHNNPILLNDPLGLTADSTSKPGFTPNNPNILPEVVVTASIKKSVGQPGTIESLIPIWGSGRAAIDDFQNGRWGWGIFNTVMAISDVFLVKSAVTAIGKLAAKGIGELTAKEGVYIIKTQSARYVGQSKNMAKRLIQHLKKGGKLSDEVIEKIMGHEMPGSTKLEREVYEQYLIKNYGGPEGGQLLNKVNPMGGRMGEYAAKLEEVITKYNLPR